MFPKCMQFVGIFEGQGLLAVVVPCGVFTKEKNTKSQIIEKILNIYFHIYTDKFSSSPSLAVADEYTF